MKLSEATRKLLEFDRKGRYVFARRDLAKVFDETGPTLEKTLSRLIESGFLERAVRDVYVFAESAHISSTTIEDIALTMRRGDYVFESLESALSQWGLISQIPIDRITLVTTGRKGEFQTPFGVIEFTHTDAPPTEIIDNVVERPGHRIPIATKEYALKNL
ncbi:MAG: hypothetical protein RR619_10975, partial [Raoultibacter sp.]